jgi:2'-5' RNA ligase
MKASNDFPKEYLIVVNPSNQICWDVKEMKYEFGLKNGTYNSQSSKAHIPLANAVLTKSESRVLLSHLKHQLSILSSFDVYLNGFDFFPESNTCYIDVVKNDRLIALQNLVLEQLKLAKPQFNASKNSFVPYITIGKQLSNKQFLDAYHNFHKQRYTNYFRLEDITILSRPLWEEEYKEEKYLPLKTEDWCLV